VRARGSAPLRRKGRRFYIRNNAWVELVFIIAAA
jgi:hypothetical protein